MRANTLAFSWRGICRWTELFPFSVCIPSQRSRRKIRREREREGVSKNYPAAVDARPKGCGNCYIYKETLSFSFAEISVYSHTWTVTLSRTGNVVSTCYTLDGMQHLWYELMHYSWAFRKEPRKRPRANLVHNHITWLKLQLRITAAQSCKLVTELLNS